MINVKWQDPKAIPKVNAGTEEQFWMAVEAKRGDEVKIFTFLAQYQNRPFNKERCDDDDYLDDNDALVNCYGDYINSVGWVRCQSHIEFDNYYTQITFRDDYKLLGWAEYTPPAFTSDNQ